VEAWPHGDLPGALKPARRPGSVPMSPADAPGDTRHDANAGIHYLPGPHLLLRPGACVVLLPSAHCRGEWRPSTTHSAIMASSVPGKLMVVEWTEDAVELHEVGF
jgi:hypothetical protein